MVEADVDVKRAAYHMYPEERFLNTKLKKVLHMMFDNVIRDSMKWGGFLKRECHRSLLC